MLSGWKDRWRGAGGYGEVLRLAFPLILSSGAQTVLLFVDSVFLMWLGQDTMAASVQGGLASFTVASFFLGVSGYVNTFVAQYSGAGRDHRVGPAVWQGIYFSVAAGLLVVSLLPAAGALFSLAGHEAELQKLEVSYFQIVCLGIGPMLISSVISSFFTGRGKPWPVMWVNTIGTGLNIVLDYGMIFGHFGFPAMGIVGAAWATVLSGVLMMVVYVGLFFRGGHRRDYNTLRGFRLEWGLFGRLMRYGVPSGVQFFLDMVAFTLFVLFVGRIEPLALAASSIAFRINTLAFLPMIGLGVAVSTLVGQALGQNNPSLAQRSTWSAFYLTFTYMTAVAVGYWLVPDVFLWPFAFQADEVEYAAMRPVVVKLLLFVAFYCLFDGGNIIFASALKGAGDTRFVMLAAVILGWLTMVIPTYLAVRWGWGLYAAWGFLTGYVCVLAALYLWRFLGGKWKTMRVIEAVPPMIRPAMSPMPPTDIETG